MVSPSSKDRPTKNIHMGFALSMVQTSGPQEVVIIPHSLPNCPPATLTTLFLFTNQQKVPGTFLRSNPPHLSCLLIMPHNLITRIYKNSCFEHLSLRVRRKKPYLFACCYSIRYRIVSYIHIKSLPLLICSLFY